MGVILRTPHVIPSEAKSRNLLAITAPTRCVLAHAGTHPHPSLALAPRTGGSRTARPHPTSNCDTERSTVEKSHPRRSTTQ